MFRELCRVAKKKVLIRCPHRRGSGAKRRHHLTYIDEVWFTDAAQSIGVTHQERITAIDFPISNRLHQKFIVKVNRGLIRGVVWRVFRHAEFMLRVPFEIECQVTKNCV